MTPQKFRIVWLCAMVAAPAAAAATPAMTADATHQLNTVWVPATVYGLTLLAVLTKPEK